ncbi:PfkB family carbohydrate kinase [Methanobacterium alcaliphilum]|uniref:PfkB family carbohydrate kinase n=1 Tax=Methanobacterium alcaliphilum TaxID=392018 RepID=UPI00200B89C2|nr:PfkB family carbohydrate kinase [Methanobacterium alcaliphilum]MCK9152044.1 PfkB family carbohydrate kinase [Methanobacterium alcaliphilum]
MGSFLLLGPVSKDTIIKKNQKTHRIGGAVYYQSMVLSGLGLKHTAAVTLSKEDKFILDEFPDKTKVIPLFKRDTVKFENNYYDHDPNHRIQRSNAPKIPVTVEDVENIFTLFKDKKRQFDGVLLGPLLPWDIPMETINKIHDLNIPIYMGLQGYLRHFDGCDIHLEPLKRVNVILKYVKILFLDEGEARAIAPNETSLAKIGQLLSGYGPDEVIITCGNRGSVIYSKKESKAFIIKAFPPSKLTDPTGLGDTFMAAYISCHVTGNSLEECGRFAAMVSTIKLENKNGFKKDWNYVLNRLNKNK